MSIRTLLFQCASTIKIQLSLSVYYKVDNIIISSNVKEFEDTKGVIRICILKKKKEQVEKDKQRSTKHIYKTKDRVTRTPLKTGGFSPRYN